MTQKITASPDCSSCHGEGFVYDWVPVPFGSGNCAMPSICDCVMDQATDDDDDIEVVPCYRRDPMETSADEQDRVFAEHY